jgi:glycerol-3-phosphate dehydrogenase (NAD(P)+)
LNTTILGNIGIIGNGSWSTALAKILTDKGIKVHWWVRNTEAMNHLKSRLHNPNYLTSVRFNANDILPTDNLAEVLNNCQTVVVGVPSAYAQSVIESVDTKLWQGKNIISAIKGILPDSNLLLNDYLAQYDWFDLQNYAAITGPCHAEEVAQERISYLTFSGLNDALTSAAAEAFHNSYIYTTYNNDIWGAQFAAVLKNIYAIGAGLAHGLDYGDNFLSVYITNCYREMYRFLEAHFDKVHPSNERPDFHTSAYLGDLLVTCYSLHSRNRMFGTMLGKGYSVKNAQFEMNMVAEGYYAARGMQTISKTLDIEHPIASSIYQVLWQGMPPKDMFEQLEKTLS